MASSPIGAYFSSPAASIGYRSGSGEPASPANREAMRGAALIAELSRSERMETALDSSLFGGRQASLSTSFLWLHTNPARRLSGLQLDLLGSALARLLPEGRNKHVGEFKKIGHQAFADGAGRFDVLDSPHTIEVVYQCDRKMQLCFLSVRGEPKERGAERPVLAEIDGIETPSSSPSLSRRSSAHSLQSLQSHISHISPVPLVSQSGPGSASSAASSPMSDFLAARHDDWTQPASGGAAPGSVPHSPPVLRPASPEPDPMDEAFRMFHEDEMPGPETGGKRAAPASREASPSPKRPRGADAKGKQRAVDSDDDSSRSDSDFEREFEDYLMRELGLDEPSAAEVPAASAAAPGSEPPLPGTVGNPIDLTRAATVERTARIADAVLHDSSAACIRFIQDRQRAARPADDFKRKQLSMLTTREVQAWHAKPAVRDWLGVRKRLVEQSGRAEPPWLFISRNGERELEAILKRRAQSKPDALPSLAGVQAFRALEALPAVMQESSFSEEERAKWSFDLDDINVFALFHDPHGPQLQKEEFLGIARLKSFKNEALTVFEVLAKDWWQLADPASGPALSREAILDIARPRYGYIALRILADRNRYAWLTEAEDGPALSKEEILLIARKRDGGLALNTLGDKTRYQQLLKKAPHGPALTRDVILSIAKVEAGAVSLNLFADPDKFGRLIAPVGPHLSSDDMIDIANHPYGGVTLNLLAHPEKYRQLQKPAPEGPGLSRDEIVDIARKSQRGVLNLLADWEKYYRLTQDPHGPELPAEKLKEIAKNSVGLNQLRSLLKHNEQ